MKRSSWSRVPGVLALLAAALGAAALGLAGARLLNNPQIPSTEAAVTEAPSQPTPTAPLVTSSTTAAAEPRPSVRVTDDTGQVSVAVPAGWADVTGGPWVVDGVEMGLAITAAEDAVGWFETWGVPGAFVGVDTTDGEPALGDFSSVCTEGKLTDRSGDSLDGEVKAWSECGLEGGDFYVFLGSVGGAEVEVLIQMVSIDGAGLEVLDEMLNTFSYQPST